MAGPRPDDPYSPNASVAPSTEAPSDTLQLRAGAESFGGQVAASVSKAGAEQEQNFNKATDLAVQYQGMLNETMVTNAEGQMSQATGQIHGDYMTLQGLDAVAKRDQTISAIQKAWKDTGDALPNLAARNAYMTMTARWQNNLIQDVVDHAAQQGKDAATASHAAAGENMVQQASNLAQPMDLIRANIQHEAAAYLQGKGMADTIVGMDAKGNLKFADTPQGQSDSKIAQAYIDDQLGRAYFNRAEAIYNKPGIQGGALAADKWLQQNQADMPPAAVAKIETFLRAPVRLAATKTAADEKLQDLNLKYYDQFNKPGQFNSQQVGQAVLGTESNFGAIVNKTSSTGATGPGQIEHDTWVRFAKPGEQEILPGTKNPTPQQIKDNLAVHQRIIDSYMQKYGGDAERAMVAYYSGEGNVAPAGSEHPWVRDISEDKKGNPIQSVSEYVKTTMDKLVGHRQGYQSLADFYSQNMATAIDDAKKAYLDKYPGEIQGADQVGQLVESHMSQEIAAQQRAVTVDNHLVIAALRGQFNNGQPLTSLDQILNGRKDVKDAYDRVNSDNPYFASRIPDLLRANIKKSDGYGTGFFKLYGDVMSGKISDPVQLVEGGYITGEKNALLTPQGFNQLAGVIDNMQDPAKKAQEQTLYQFLNSPQIRGKIAPGGPAGDKYFEKFLEQTIPQIEGQLGQGVPLQKILNDKDFLTNMSHFMRSDAETMSDMYKNSMANVASGANNIANIKSQDDLAAVMKSAHPLTRGQFDLVAKRLGLVREEPDQNKPPVPAPN